jgi:hypothetical protein
MVYLNRLQLVPFPFPAQLLYYLFYLALKAN